MILPTPNPIAFTALGLEVRWYGICIAIGILIGLFIAYKRAPLHTIPPERVIDLTLISLPLGIVGARLYYVIFHLDYYGGDFYKMIDIRSGGLAIHGGLILGLLAAAVCCRIWQIRPLNLLDLMVPSIALAQAIGRWGNYFNQEAHGGPTDLPWAIEVNGQMVHPTFLYESIWCLLLFGILIYVDSHRYFTGQTFLLYGILYSLERFFVEQLRTDSLMFGDFKVAQLFSAAIFILFLIIYITMSRKYSRKNRMFY
jgi:phosphatidylglycerol---prolipoprotein diacylglyceryl transferase